MRSRYLILIAIGLVILLGVGIALYQYFGAGSVSTATPPDSSDSNGLPVANLSDEEAERLYQEQQAAARSGTPISERIDIQGDGGIVSVKNFYLLSTFVIGQSEVILAIDPEYSITFDRDNQTFMIVDFVGSPSDFIRVRQVSETALLALLDIERKEACKLSVVHTVPATPATGDEDPRYYPLGNCPDAIPTP